MSRYWILDLDDTLANTTRDMHDDESRVPYLTLVPGADVFLEKYGTQCTVVTIGNWVLQEAKLSHLGIRTSRFVITPGSALTNTAKKSIIKGVLSSRNLPLENAVLVGDRLDRDIRAGRELGITTVQMKLRGGKYAGQVPQSSFEVPDHVVSDFFELMKLPLFADTTARDP